MMENKFRIYSILPFGQENAVARRDLCAALGLEDRALRRQIALERKKGALILSSTSVDGGGYFRPGSAEEIVRFVQSMDRRARATFAAASNARKELCRLGYAPPAAERKAGHGKNVAGK